VCSSDLRVTSLEQALRASGEAVNVVLDRAIPARDGPDAKLFEAMRYSALAGGKRLRPFLVLAGADMFDVPRDWSLPTAAAIEMVHTYSLVHDDLPAMDDDDLRRGQPTCHVAFDEATAILAGDGLLTMAFELAADPAGHPDGGVRASVVHALAVAAGADGMAGGQAMDLAAETEAFDIETVIKLQNKKTGALFGFSCEAGALLGEQPQAARAALRTYATKIGLAFQIADDLLDHEGDAADLGKAVGKDAAAGKATFVSLLGAEEAHRRADRLTHEAIAALEQFGPKAELFREAAYYIVNRRN